jgi:biotin carboxylase
VYVLQDLPALECTTVVSLYLAIFRVYCGYMLQQRRSQSSARYVCAASRTTGESVHSNTMHSKFRLKDAAQKQVGRERVYGILQYGVSIQRENTA